MVSFSLSVLNLVFRLLEASISPEAWLLDFALHMSRATTEKAKQAVDPRGFNPACDLDFPTLSHPREKPVPRTGLSCRAGGR